MGRAYFESNRIQFEGMSARDLLHLSTANSMSSAYQRQGDRCFFMASQRQCGDRHRFSMRDSTGSGLGHAGNRLDGPARPAPLVLTSTKNSYEVMSFLGQGAFGKVLSCKNTVTNRTVAVKMVKDSTPGSKREFEILRRLQQQRFDPDEHNFVRCFQFFHFSGSHCLVFEQLHMSLKEFISRYQPLSLGEIRPIVQQVATVLQMLKRAGIIHTDLKPDNIMLVDHHHQPLRVKVIDFGCACTTSEVKCGANVQTPWYRSPEILLGLSYTGAIDMWSLGCVAAELFLGAVLFPGTSEYDIMRFITETQGLPPAHLLHASTKTNMYFTRDLTGVRRLKTPVEASVRSGGTRVYTLCSLDGMKDIHPLSTELKSKYLRTKDRHRFVDLLKKMLEIDPGKRLEPEHVLQHSFVTMSHLVDSLQHSSFVRSCYDKMGVCQTQRVTAPTERKRPSSEAAESSPDRKRSVCQTQRVTAPTERKRPSSEAAESSPDRKRSVCQTQRVTAPTERKRPSSEAAESSPDRKRSVCQTQRVTAPTERKRPSSEAAESSPDRKRKK